MFFKIASKIVSKFSYIPRKNKIDIPFVYVV